MEISSEIYDGKKQGVSYKVVYQTVTSMVDTWTSFLQSLYLLTFNFYQEPQLDIPKPTLLPSETGSCNLGRVLYLIVKRKGKLYRQGGKIDGSI